MIPLLKQKPGNPNYPGGQYAMKPGLNNRRGDSDRTEIEEVTRQKQRQLIYVFLTVLFGISVLLFIVGLLYLTVFFYRWSFIEFSTTICAALFISFGGTLIIMIILNGIMVRADRFQFVLLTPLVSFAFFGTLLGIGIWGLAVSHDPRLSDEVSEFFHIFIRIIFKYYK